MKTPERKKELFAFAAPIAAVLVFSILLAFTFSEKNIRAKFKVRSNVEQPSSETPLQAGMIDQPEDQTLTLRGERMLQRELMVPIKKKLNITTEAGYFSRCPSGLEHNLVDTPSKSGEGFFKGTILNYVGCDAEIICEFRINKQETTLEVKSPEGEYVEVGLWVREYLSEGDLPTAQPE